MWPPVPEEQPDHQREPEDDTTPGVVIGARVLLGLQGVLCAALFFYAAVQMIGVWAIVDADRSILQNLGILAIAVISLVLVSLAALALAVTIPSFILAARFPKRRKGVRLGTLTLEAIVGVLVLCLILLLVVVFSGRLTLGSFGVMALPWTIFGLMISPQARTYFRR